MNFTGNDVIVYLLLHMLGDYVIQTNWMANEKTKRWSPAFIHGFVYAVPFAIAFKPSLAAWLVIFLSHVIIDHYRLARHVIFAKNWLGDRSLKWSECDKTGYPNGMPPWMSVWLMIAVDNTMHLTFNYLSLRYL